MLDAQGHEQMDMMPVARPRHDREMWKSAPDHLRGLDRGVHVIQCEHQHLGGFRAGRAHHLLARGISVEDFRAEAPHDIHLLLAFIQRGEADFLGG